MEGTTVFMVLLGMIGFFPVPELSFLFEPKQLNAKPWPRGHVPYTVSPNFSKYER